MFKKITLKNGLRVILAPKEESLAVTILILVETGSKYEKKENSGISHFLEHLLFKGTEKRPTPLAISEPLDGVGGVYNAFTSEEYTGYYAKVEKKHFSLALDVLSDIYLNSKLDKLEIEKEKGVIIEEINMITDHPSSLVQILWNEVLYGDQPAGWNIAGNKKTVSNISRENIFNYKNRQYTSLNTIICMAGAIGSEKKALKEIEKYFKKIRTEKPFNKLKVLEIQKKPNCLLKEKETDQTHLCMGVRAFDVFSSKKYSQEILAAVLGGMMSSRLFTEIREKLGLAYYISASSDSFTDHGYIVVQAGVDNKKAEKAISAILEEFKKIKTKKIPSKELSRAKDNIKGKMALILETSEANASFYGMQEILEKKILTPVQIYDKINKVSQEDILKISKDIFRPEKLNLALIGPFKDKIKFEKILKL